VRADRPVWLLGWLASLVVLVTCWVDAARAHGLVVRTDPPAGAVLREPPRQISVWFTETVLPEFAAVRVRGPHGEPINVGAGYVIPGEDRRYVAALPPDASKGTYLVTWRFFSRIDGHLSVGSFPYSIGVAPSVWDAGDSLDTPTAVESVARWLTLAGSAVAAGTPLALLRAMPKSAATRRLLALLRTGATAVLVGVLVEAVDRVMQAGSGAFGTQFLTLLPGSLAGALLLGKLGLAAALLLTATRGAIKPLLAVGIGFLVTSAAAGHAASTPWPAAALPLQIAHNLASAVWVGGLLLIVMVRLTRASEGSGELGAVIQRLSPLFLASAAVLIASGVARAVMEVGSVERLLGTSYGWLLEQKVALVLALLMLGATSFLLSRGRAVPRPAFRTVVILEALVALGVLLAAGRLAQAEPAREAITVAGPAWPAPAQEHAADGLVVGISPPDDGSSALRLVVRAAQTGQPWPAAQVRVRFAEPTAADAAADVQAQPVGSGHFVVPTSAANPTALQVVVEGAPQGAELLTRFGLGQPSTSSPAPFPDAPAVLTRALQTMRALASVRVREQVADLPVRPVAQEVTWAEYQAPDRARYWIENGPAGIVIGQDEYTESANGWAKLPRVHVFQLPAHFDYLLHALDTKLLGTAVVAGERTTKVLLYDPQRSVTVTLWVADDGRILRELTDESQTRDAGGGDFVTRDFYDFNAVPDIVAPPTS